jgi:hypothetical protein
MTCLDVEVWEGSEESTEQLSLLHLRILVVEPCDEVEEASEGVGEERRAPAFGRKELKELGFGDWPSAARFEAVRSAGLAVGASL